MTRRSFKNLCFDIAVVVGLTAFYLCAIVAGAVAVEGMR